MATWPELDVQRLLEELTGGGVDFVVIGGLATVLHGSARLTRDLDVSYAPERSNLIALGQVLQRLDARLRGIPEELPFVPDERTLDQTQLLTLETSAGWLDLLRDPPGGPTYAELRSNATRMEAAGVTVLVASIEHLLAMKRAAGRPQDLVDVEELEAIRRLSG